MGFGIFSRLFLKKEDSISKKEFSDFKNKAGIELEALKAQVLNNSTSFDKNIHEILHAVHILDEDLSELKQKSTTRDNTNHKLLEQKITAIKEHIEQLEKNQKDLMAFGKLSIQNHEQKCALEKRVESIETSITTLSEKISNLTTSLNSTKEQLTKPVNSTKIEHPVVDFENDNSNDDDNTLLNQQSTRNGLVNLTKPGLVKFSLVDSKDGYPVIAPQEQRILFYIYNLQGDTQDRSITIKSIVEGMYGVLEHSKTSYISHTMSKLAFLGLVSKQRTGKSVNVWLTGKAIEYCRKYIIERFERK